MSQIDAIDMSSAHIVGVVTLLSSLLLAAPLAAQGAGGQSATNNAASAKNTKVTATERVNTPTAPVSADNKGASGESLKELLKQINAAEAQFIKEHQALQQQLKNAKEEQRDLIRSQIQDKKDQFFQQQKELRDDYRRRVLELRDQLKDHKDLIDDAKEQIKSKPRKGGDN